MFKNFFSLAFRPIAMDTYKPYHGKELLQKLAQGDEAAFTQLFHAYRNKLYSFIFQLTGSSATAEDVLQDVFLRIWQNRYRVTEIDNFNAYLFRMARNHAVNGLRRQAHEAVILYEATSHIPYNAGTEDIFSAKELHGALHSALNQLPPQQRNVFELSRNHGLKYAEIADRLNISETTVRKHMIQALKNIRKFIVVSHPDGAIYCLILLYTLQ